MNVKKHAQKNSTYQNVNKNKTQKPSWMMIRGWPPNKHWPIIEGQLVISTQSIEFYSVRVKQMKNIWRIGMGKLPMSLKLHLIEQKFHFHFTS